MGYQSCKPSGVLSSFVKQYWAIQNDLTRTGSYNHRIIPNGLVELMFFFDDIPSCSVPGLNYTSTIIVSGQIDLHYELTITGKLDMISVTLQPHAISMLFGVPAYEIHNQNVPLKCLLNKENDQLYNQLGAVNDFNNRVLLIENFLLSLLKKRYDSFKINRIEDSLKQIKNYRGIIDVESLASRACLSRKQYVRTFSNYIGLPPKRFLRTVRFQHALYLLQTGGVRNFTDLAYQCGYYDQAHMNNEFKDLSGLTPGQFMIGCKPYSDYFSL